MKNGVTILIIMLILFSFCSPTRKMHYYNIYKKEVVKDVFHEFEKYLPASYENSLMAQIRYAPSYNAFGCSGIDVLFSLGDFSFKNNIQKLHEANKVPSNLFDDTLAINRSNSEYYSLFYNQQKIAIPKVKDDFCRVNDTCFKWDDLETVILETGTKKVFSKNVAPEFQPENPNCNYSIGAFVSKKKQHIIYWLFIYN